MKIKAINKAPQFYKKASICFYHKSEKKLPEFLTQGDNTYVKSQLSLDKNIIPVFHSAGTSYLLAIKKNESIEGFRKMGNEVFALLKANKETSININGLGIEWTELLAFAEGIALTAYQFLKYFEAKEKTKKSHALKQINLHHNSNKLSDIKELQSIIKAVYWARDMVNEPLISLNATQFAKQVSLLGVEAGFKVEVLDKKKIESLKMGGLLAVNKGSIDPPTFTICEYKPKNAVNKKPYVLVGKGVMYDTGGLSLKPTPNSMDEMKSDMAGAAGVAGAIYATSLSKLPVWLIGLLPATDNRPDGNAYTPGDIIKMFNGLHVEVMNTDAEGRLIMADALSYGDKYKPELIIDMATLTGSAQIAIGKQASVCMGNAKKGYFTKLLQAGENKHERLVIFPFWDDYSEALKSPIADLKNLGNREAGAISAGKFLEHFTKSAYIHIDIAGTAFLNANDAYRLKGGTGVGVRMLTEFFKIVSKPQ